MKVFSFLSLLALACQVQAAPNVILIVTDDQGYGDMSGHGNPWLKTPNLDRLRGESVRLEDYHVDPLCTPTRAALMTGRYCVRVGAWAVTEGRQLLNPDEVTMANVFADSGYRTGMFGKWHLGDPYPFGPEHRGFQDVVRHRAGGVQEIGNPTGNDYFDDTYYRNGKPEKFTGYCTDIWFGELNRFIHRKEPKPFFVYLPLNAMHGPFTVAEKYSAPFRAKGLPEDRSKFFGMIQNFDENLGRLLADLRESGLERDTIVIFFGDNGSAAGTNGKGGKAEDGFNAGMKGKKASVYEGGHRVACFVRWPARLKAGRSVDQLTAHIDWLPTLIDLCGLKTPAEVKFDGRSIVPLLEGNAKGWPDRTLVVERQADHLEKWNGNRKPTATPQFAVLSVRWRLVNGELYDLASDPGQDQDVAKQHPDVVKKLFAAHDEWFADVTTHQGAFTPFQLGAEQENPTTFTVRDWHPVEGRVIWEPDQLADDSLFVNGFWAVDVQRAGRYEIRLSRFPEDGEQPMRASEARLKIGDEVRTSQVSPDAGFVIFEVNLPKGPALLQTYLKDAKTGRERGAYFIRCTWRGASE